jgi:hypothetical protein
VLDQHARFRLLQPLALGLLAPVMVSQSGEGLHRDAKAFKPGHLGVQVIGVSIQVHARGSLAEALGEQPEFLAAQRGTVILG